MNDEIEQTQLTFGDKAVGITFNPSSNMDVNEIKAYYAAVIDFLHDRMGDTDDPMKKMLYEMALEDAIRAQMSAVKYITWSLPRE